MKLKSVNKVTKDDLSDSLIAQIEMGLLVAGAKSYSVKYSETKQKVSFIGGEIDTFNIDRDSLHVFFNTIKLTEGEHYTIDVANNAIVATDDAGFVYDKSKEPQPNLFEFFVLSLASSDDIQITSKNISEELLQTLSSRSILSQTRLTTGTYTTSDSFIGSISYLQGNIVGFDPLVDTMFVYSNGLKLILGIDYEINASNNTIIYNKPNLEEKEYTLIFEVLSGLVDTSDSADNITTKIDELSTSVDSNSSDIDEIKEEIEDLKSSVSNGKSIVAAAITGKGIETAATDSFTTMSENISRIETGGNEPTGTALPEHVLSGYTFSSDNGIGLEGSMESISGGTYVTGREDIVFEGGKYLETDIVLSGDKDLLPENIKVGSVICTTQGTFTADATALDEDLRIGKTAYVNGNMITGTVEDCPYDSIDPGKDSSIINAGYYLANDITINGDDNLIPENIKSGVTIFGVEGEFSDDTTANPSNLLYGETAISKGQLITGTINSLYATDYTPGSEDIIIEKGKYLAEDQTIKGDTNLIPEFIKSGVSIFGVEGTFGVELQERQFEILAADAELTFSVTGVISHIMIVTSTGVSIWMPGKYIVQEGGTFEVAPNRIVENSTTHIKLSINSKFNTIKYTNEYGLAAVAKAYLFYV